MFVNALFFTFRLQIIAIKAIQHGFSTPIMIACTQNNNIMFYVFNMYLNKSLKMEVDASMCFELISSR